MDSIAPQKQAGEKGIKFVKIGKVTISLNALLVLVTGFLFALVVMFIFPPYSIFVGIYVLLIIMILAYNNNCVIVGHCKVWAWILTIFYLVYFVFGVYYLFSFKKNLGKLSKILKASKK